VDQKPDQQPGGNKYLNRAPEIFASILVVIIFSGPFLVRAAGHLPASTDNVVCPAGYEKLTIDMFPGGYMNVTSAGIPYSFLPNVREKEIGRISKAYPFVLIPGVLEEWPGLEKFIQALKSGDTLLMGVTHEDLSKPSGSEKVIFVLARTDKITNFQGTNTFCGSLAAEARLNNNRFYYDISENPDLSQSN